jgi:hypothetical protein
MPRYGNSSSSGSRFTKCATRALRTAPPLVFVLVPVSAKLEAIAPLGQSVLKPELDLATLGAQEAEVRCDRRLDLSTAVRASI